MAEMYAVPEETLSDIADAIRLKRDITTPLTVDDMALQIGLIEGGGVEVASGTFELASNVSVPAAGYTLPFTMPFMPDFVVVWFDADDFLAIETPANNRYYRISAFRVPENVPPIYLAGNLSVQNASRNGYAFAYSTNANVNTGTASPNGYGISALITAAVNTNTYTNWGITDDCAVRIARFSSAAPSLYAGKYHWVAVKGIPAYFT